MSRPCDICDRAMTREPYHDTEVAGYIYLCPACDAPGHVWAPQRKDFRDIPKI